ncbi:MAG TPA: sugar ABC transporter substrate-binding protein [Candidatus Atribacteria bacterium]|nr:sugar ABC transporter substrate-binding protein [Candidatus Atribacteria bacterium]
MKRLFIFLLMTLLIFSLFTTMAFAKQEITLKVVTRTWAKELIKYATSKLQAAHPDLNIKVDASYYEYNECRTQLAIRLSRKEPIDAIIVDHIWLGEFKDMILPLDISEIKGYDDYLPSFKALMEKYAPPKKTLGLYAATDIRLLFWNKELMQKLGINSVDIKTWDDVKRYAKMIKAKENLLPKGVKPVGFMAGNSEHTNSRWYDYLWAAGGDILTKDEKEAKFNDKEGVAALEFYGWFLKNGMVAPEDVVSPANGAVYDEAFLNGKFVISLGNGHWLGTSTAKNVGLTKEQFISKFGATLIPAPEGGERGTTVAGGYLWCVSKFAKHPKLTLEFIEYITNAEGYNQPGTGKNGIPTLKSALPTIDNLPYADIIKEAVKHARFRPTIPEYPKIAEEIRDAIQEYVMNYDKKSAKEILDKAAKKVNEILK